MRLSLYTFVKNGLHLDYHVVAMLKHHIPLADEIIVHEGMSTDGTFEAISALHPKVKIFRSDWDQYKGLDWVNHFKDQARRRCTGDWCVLLDADEFIPDWEFDSLRRTLASTDRVALCMRLLNFYGNYKVYNAFPEEFRWPAIKQNIHRNRDDIRMHGGDASSVTFSGDQTALDPANVACTLHHFGSVRKPARLREMWRNMRGRLYNAPQPKIAVPSWMFNYFPHNWKDPDFLPYLRVYDGPYCQAVRDDPAEFTRDRMQLFQYLQAHPPETPAS